MGICYRHTLRWELRSSAQAVSAKANESWERQMLSSKYKYLILILLIQLFILGTGTTAFTLAHGNITGKIVYTAEVPASSATDLMFTIDLGSNPEAGRTVIAGDKSNSAAYPRPNHDGNALLCHDFPDTDHDGTIDQNTTTPLIGSLKLDGTDLTPLTDPKQGAAYNADFSPDERQMVFSFANTDTDRDGVLTIHDQAHLATKELGLLDPLNPTPRQFAINRPIKVLTKNEDFSVENPVYLTDNLIVFTGRNLADDSTTVYMYDESDGNLTPIAPAGAQSRNPAISHDGTQIAVTVITLTDSYDAVYNISAKTWARLPSSGVTNNSLAWSVNGTMAMAVSNGSNWQIILFDGNELLNLVELPQKISALNFSPDGKAIAYLWDRDGSNHNVLSVATLDGGYMADVSPPDSNVKDYDWVRRS